VTPPKTYKSSPKAPDACRARGFSIGGIEIQVLLLPSVEMYDPQKDKWFDLPDFPESISWFNVCSVSNAIIVTGGILEGNIVSKVWKFEGSSRTWISMPPMLNR
jgi:hypothetical protein